MFEEDSSAAGYWPSVSDLFMTLFIIGLVMVAALYYVLMPVTEPKDERLVVEAVGAKMAEVRKPVNSMRKPLGGEELPDESSPGEVIAGLHATADEVVARLEEMNDSEVGELLDNIKELRGLLADERAAVARLNATLTDLRSERELEDETMRTIVETEEKRFGSGSAEMSGEFLSALNKDEFEFLRTEILSRNHDGLMRVDTLEIIGHTDGVPMGGGGNLDTGLLNYLDGGKPNFSSLRAGSNNDLGLLRALAVSRAWGAYIGNEIPEIDRDRLRSIDVRCYSAGQTIPPDGALLSSKDNPKARRIEIRLIKLRKQAEN